MNKINFHQIVKWFLVINVAVTLMLKARMLGIYFSWRSDAYTYYIVSLFVMGCLGSIVGLSLNKFWGFICFYVLVPFAIYYLGISITPLDGFFPYPSKIKAIYLLNGLLFAFAIWLQIAQRRTKKT